MEDKNNPAVEQGQEGQGRTHNMQNEHGQENYKPVHQSNDISDIDQQEGAMHNGVTGGNTEDIQIIPGDTGNG